MRGDGIIDNIKLNRKFNLEISTVNRSVHAC